MLFLLSAIRCRSKAELRLLYLSATRPKSEEGAMRIIDVAEMAR